MTRVQIGVAFVCVLLPVSLTHGAIVEWTVASGGNGHFYGLIGDYLDPAQRWSWQTSKVMAEGMTHLGMTGHLATISSAAENQFLIDTFHLANPWPTWLGMTDSEAYGGSESFGQANPQVDGWRWVTGEAVTYTAWPIGQPDNLNDEDFLIMGNPFGEHHMWNDTQSGTAGDAPFFIEFDPVPEPASMFLWSFGAVAGIALACRTRLKCQVSQY